MRLRAMVRAVALFFISLAYSMVNSFDCFYGFSCKKCITFAIEKNEILTIKNYKIMKKHRCIPCGWIYDPAIGDPENGIAAGTPFEELPEDWACPLCGADKESFEEL